MTYEKVVEHILEIPKFTKKNSLSHTKEFLYRLGEPQNSFSMIHVAGSNGKGSVCAYLNSIFQQGGISVGMFTSPHLVDLRERFLICGRMCTKEEFLRAEMKVRKVAEEMEKETFSHPSFFEYLFAVAMVIFQEKKVQYVLLETGLGGRLDATNIIESPLLTIITSLSLEHTEILGDTIEKIAAEKAGIIKYQVPVIVDGTNKSALSVVKKAANTKEAPTKIVDQSQIQILNKTAGMIEFSIASGREYCKIKIKTSAEYQVMNAALAWMAANDLRTRLNLTEEMIVKGLEDMKWPGRMEEILPEVYVDGAHNPAGIQMFLQSVKEIAKNPSILVFSMVQEKDYQQVIQLLCEKKIFDIIIVTEISHNKRKLSLDRMKDYFIAYDYPEGKILTIQSPTEALEKALEIRQIHQKVFCAGSLYLVGELKKEAGGYHD